MCLLFLLSFSQSFPIPEAGKLLLSVCSDLPCHIAAPQNRRSEGVWWFRSLARSGAEREQRKQLAIPCGGEHRIRARIWGDQLVPARVLIFFSCGVSGAALASPRKRAQTRASVSMSYLIGQLTSRSSWPQRGSCHAPSPASVHPEPASLGPGLGEISSYGARQRRQRHDGPEERRRRRRGARRRWRCAGGT